MRAGREKRGCKNRREPGSEKAVLLVAINCH